MRSYCAVYVDVGYLLAAAATRVTGTSLRKGIVVSYPDLVARLIADAEQASGLPLLRLHWYDSVTRLLSVAGFLATDGGLDRWDVARGARLYVDALETFLSCVHFPTPEDRVALQRRVALEVLRRMR